MLGIRAVGKGPRKAGKAAQTRAGRLAVSSRLPGNAPFFVSMTANATDAPDPGLPLPRLEGPSYPRTVKALATAMVAAVAAFGSTQLPLLLAGGLTAGPTLLAVAGALMLGGSYLGLMRSTTAIDGRQIVQRGWSTRSVELRQVVQCKLIRVRGLEWLITPRLLVRAGAIGQRSFSTADPRVLAAFERFALGENPAPGA